MYSKTYVADSGILHALLGLPTVHNLLGHPKVGASWEGFVIRQILSHLGVREEEAFFWGVHTGAELDLLVVRGGKRVGFEIKRTTAPRSTRSMRSALDILQLERLTIVHAGEHSFEIDDQIRAVSIDRILTDIPPV